MVATSDGFIRSKIFIKRANGFCQSLTQRWRTHNFANMAFDRDQIKKKAAALAAKGVFVGTSSWKYEGWFDKLY